MRWADMVPGDVWWTGLKLTSRPTAGWMLISVIGDVNLRWDEAECDVIVEKPDVRALRITHIQLFGSRAGHIQTEDVFSDMIVPGQLMLIPR